MPKHPLLAIATVAALSTPVFAESDLAFSIQDLNHQKSSGWIFDKLVTLEVGPKCMAKIADKNNGALAKLAAQTRYIARYAKTITGDDWDHIETQSTGDKEKIGETVHKMVDDFAPKFHVTVSVEGDDCDAKGNALWISYTTDALLALDKYPPKSGTMTIKINATTKVKEHKAEINKAGTSLTVTAPRDIEPGPWADHVEKMVRRISSKG